MRDHRFEYTDTKFTLKLFGLSFLIFVALLIAMVVTVDLMGVVASLILAFGTPLSIFLLNNKKIKKQGTANIYDSYSEIKLGDSNHKVVYADIKTYQIERYGGTHLRIKYKDGEGYRLNANSTFCNSDQFNAFCDEFEKTIQQYKTADNVGFTRIKSMFERAWMLPVLIILTIGIVGTVIFAMSQGKNIPSSLYSSAAVVIPLWIGYMNAKKRKQEQKIT